MASLWGGLVALGNGSVGWGELPCLVGSSYGPKNSLVRVREVGKAQPQAWGKWLGFSSPQALL